MFAPNWKTATVSLRLPVRNLLEYAALKLLAMRVGATAIERKRDLVTIKFRQNAEIDPGKAGEVRFVPARRAVYSGRHAEVCFKGGFSGRGPDTIARAAGRIVARRASLAICTVVKQKLEAPSILQIQ